MDKPFRIVLAAAGLAVVAATPASSQTAAPARWEYAMLTLVSTGTIIPIWNAGDTTAVLEWPREQDIGTDTKPRTIPQASSQVRVLNALGEQGWEVVTQASAGRGAAVYLFKRRRN